jgi:RimJ/RimL family protein N-acetyltransferase
VPVIASPLEGASGAANNQTRHLAAWQGTGAVKVIPAFSDRGCNDALRRAVSMLSAAGERARIRERAQSLIDGQGARRVAARLIDGVVEQRLVIRKAQSSDAHALLEISNDPVTRANSLSSAAIPEQEHLAWFARQLASPAVCFVVAEMDGLVIGQLRLAFSDGVHALVSISVGESGRQWGVGRRLLQRGIEMLRAEHRGIKEIDAVVKTENRPSLKFFEKLGFAVHAKEDAGGIPTVRYRLQL